MPKPEYIDLTPSWRSIVDILLEAVLKGETIKVRQEARTELYRMATIADKYVAYSRSCGA